MQRLKIRLENALVLTTIYTDLQYMAVFRACDNIYILEAAYDLNKFKWIKYKLWKE